MPRKSYKKKKPYPKRKYKKRSSAVTRFIGPRMQRELKYADDAQASTCSYNGTVYSLVNGVIAENDSTYRGSSGQKAQLKNLLFRFTLQAAAVATVYQPSVVRVVLFCDKNKYDSGAAVATGAQPTTVPGSFDLLQTTGSVQAVNTPIDRITAGGRFIVLRDMLIALDPARQIQYARKVFMKLNIPYMGSVDIATGSNMFTQNNIYVLFISDQSTNLPSFTYSSRVRFDDD